MIPLKPPEIPGFQLGAIYVPTFELGGDFYDFLPLPPDNMGIAVCDVVGKGVRASLLMASTRASLRAHAANIYSMSEVVSRVNRDLCDDALVSDFATLFYGVLNYKTRRFTYCDAGHPPAILLRDGHASYLSTGGSVIGIDTTLEWKHDVVDLKSGDVLIAYTDGLSEALNFDNEAFGRERIERAALAGIAAGQPAEGVVRHVLWEMRRFAGLQTRFDDLTIIAIKAL
jgi:sigma-B regulation protein RsbU (phosphoserine phosphatase)